MLISWGWVMGYVKHAEPAPPPGVLGVHGRSEELPKRVAGG